MEQLDVGSKLLLSFADMGDRLVGVLVGKKIDDGLVVYANLPEETRKRIKKNNKVTVQFAHESTLLGFHSQVDGPDQSGECIFHLSWPRSVEEMDRRTNPRVPCFFPGRIHVDGATQACLVEDMCEGGLRVRLRGAEAEELRQKIQPGQSVTLDFAPFDPDHLYNARCTLLKTYRAKRSPYLVLLLDKVDENFRTMIRDHVERVREEAI